jgi:hypothetical protein
VKPEKLNIEKPWCEDYPNQGFGPCEEAPFNHRAFVFHAQLFEIRTDPHKPAKSILLWKIYHKSVVGAN